MISLPAAFVGRADRGPEWARWLQALPRLMADVLAEWQLEPDGEPMTGETAVVVPVVTASAERAVVKFGLPHPEAAHEHLALVRIDRGSC